MFCPFLSFENETNAISIFYKQKKSLVENKEIKRFKILLELYLNNHFSDHASQMRNRFKLITGRDNIK